MTDTRIDLAKYMVVSIWWGCNNDCSLCMLSGLKHKLPPIGFEKYKQLIDSVVKDRSFENLILSGAEVTTFDDLGRYVRYAASFGWFKKIQIQTNGRRLSDSAYLEHLIDCGVNEFFISVHGLEDVHDAIARRPGAYKETLAGIHHLEDLGIPFITNTVLTRENYHQTVPLMTMLGQTKAMELHLWNLFPMEAKDGKNLIVRIGDFLELLPEITSTVKSLDKHLILKAFPHCLAVHPPVVLDGRVPAAVLPDRFWQEFQECGFGTCVYRNDCRAQDCWGLSRAYIQKYGQEKNMLSPIS
ncbi:MAG: radical SAM protein [Deltaproteobacteria bacterium]|nr:radical SAM protein [Deltaproteobacteria bacterium]